MNELLLFGSTLGMVFFAGFQSLAVNSGYRWLAVCNSFSIGVFNLALFKTAPHVQGAAEIACYLLGGPLGILCAMWAHGRVARLLHPVAKGKEPIVLRSGIRVWPSGQR